MTASAGPIGERPPWLVRIRPARDADPIGAGMLLPDGHVITCAHVVGRWSQQALVPLDRVWIEFQYVRGSEPEPIEAVIAEGGWHPPASEEARTADVAVLRPTGPLPEGAKAAPLRSTRAGTHKHEFSTYGYPRYHEQEGIPSRGVIVGPAGNEWLQLEASSERGQALEEGFSGAPVWDWKLHGVIGLVVTRDPRSTQRDPRTGYAIPCDVLGRYWPAVVPYLDRYAGVEEIGADALEALLEIGLGPGFDLPAVREVDIYDIGVSASKTRTEAGTEGSPYVPRRADRELRSALDEGRGFLLVVGDSKSGKSRTATQLLRERLPDARLIVPRSDPPSLSQLARVALPTGQDAVVVWLDELDRFLGPGGLDLKVLDRFAHRAPPVVVVATITSKRHDAVLATGDSASRTARSVLNRATVVRLDSRLKPDELADAERLYPDEDFTERGIGEQLVAAPKLEQRYEDGRESNPAGWAALRAAIDWRRMGLQSPLSQSVLEAVFSRYLGEDRPDLDASPELLAAGLAWAREPVAGTVALLLRNSGDNVAYRPYDYIVAYADGQGRADDALPIPEFMWEQAIGSLDDESLLMLTFGALARGRRELAQRAAQAAHTASATAETAAQAAFVLGELAIDEGNLDDARLFLEEAVASASADLLPMAQADLAGVLFQQGREPERVRTLFDAALASGDEAVVSTAQLGIGVLLMNAGDMSAAGPFLEAALGSQDPEVGSAVEAQLKGQLAGQEKAERAEAKGPTEGKAGLAPPVRGRRGPAPDAVQSEFSRLVRQSVVVGREKAVVSLAQASLGGLLVNTGDIERARVLLESVLQSGNTRVTPLARVNYGTLLLRSGDLAGARKMFESATKASDPMVSWLARTSLGALLIQGGIEVARGRELLVEASNADLPEAAARALCTLGDIEFEEGDLDAAATAFQRAEQTGHPQWGSYATVGLALVLGRRGDPVGSRRLLEPIAASGHTEQTARASDLIGDLLLAAGDEDGAEAAYRRAATSEHHVWASVATMDLATLLFRRGDTEEAFALTQGVVGAGDPSIAPWASIQLGEMRAASDDVDGAEAAYRTVLESAHPDAAQVAGIYLGNLNINLGNEAAARTFFEQAADGPNVVSAARAADLLGDFLVDRDPDGAEAAYRRAIAGGSAEWTAQAQVDLARLLLARSEDIAAAEPLLEAAGATSFPIPNATARIILGVIRLYQGDRTAAEEQFRRAETVGPPSVVSEARLQIAKIAFETGEFERAEEMFDGLVRSPATVDHVREDAQLLLDAVHLRQGSPADGDSPAPGDGRDAIQTLLRRGDVMFDANQIEAAEGYWGAAAASNAAVDLRAEAEVGLGMVRLVQHRWEDARELLQTAVDSGLQTAVEGRARRYLASALLQLDRREEAKEHLLRLVDLTDDDHRPRGLLLLGQLAEVDSALPEAREWFEQAAASGDPEVESEADAALDELRARAPIRRTSPAELEQAGVSDLPVAPVPTSSDPLGPPLPASVLVLLAEVALAEGKDAEARLWMSRAEITSP